MGTEVPAGLLVLSFGLGVVGAGIVSGLFGRRFDFGIARLMDGAKMTATNLFVGTLAYAAPEILTGEPAIPASDQYALACTTF